MMDRSRIPAVLIVAGALLAAGCATASDPEDAASPEQEPVEDDGPDAADEPAEPEVDEPAAPPAFDPARFTLTTSCSDAGPDAPVEVEVADGVAELPEDELRSVLNVEVVGELRDSQQVLFLDCWQTGASFNSSTSVEVVSIAEDGTMTQTELVGPMDGSVTSVDIDGDEAVIALEQPDFDATGETLLRMVRASPDGSGWSVAQEGSARRALDGPGVRIVVDEDSPWAWEYVDACTGTLSAPTDGAWTTVYASGGGTDTSELDRLLAAEGGRALEPLPRGASSGARATAEGFDAIGQPALRDEVLIGDSDGRLRWLVAIDGPADQVLDDILDGLELLHAPDEVFTQTGMCEPDDYVG